MNDRPLVRLLTVIDEDGCPTRKLLKGMSSNELHPLLTRAKSEGYIRREERKPGNYLVCNYLTEKVKTLVDIAR